MIDDNQLDIFVKSICERFDAVEAHKIFMRFMCRCLDLIKPFLPPTGKEELEIAKAHWFHDVGQIGELESARVRCWQYLDQKGQSVEISDREAVAMRALLCVLYPEPTTDDFSSETVRWFIGLLNRLGDYSMEVSRLMVVP